MKPRETASAELWTGTASTAMRWKVTAQLRTQWSLSRTSAGWEASVLGDWCGGVLLLRPSCSEHWPAGGAQQHQNNQHNHCLLLKNYYYSLLSFNQWEESFWICSLASHDPLTRQCSQLIGPPLKGCDPFKYWVKRTDLQTRINEKHTSELIVRNSKQTNLTASQTQNTLKVLPWTFATTSVGY